MGNASSGAAGESAFDLFDRWLAHREGRAEGETDGGAEADRGVEPPVDLVDDPLFDESYVASQHEELALEPDDVPALALSPDPEPEPEPEPEDPGRAVFNLFNRAPVTSAPVTSAPEPATPPTETVAAAPRGPAPRTEGSRGAVVTEPLPDTAVLEDSLPHQPDQPDHDVIPGVVEFAPRTGARRLVGLLLLVCVGATALAGNVAYQDRTTPAIGLASALALLTMVVWGVRAGAATAHLTVRGGQLEIVRGGGRNVFDLASHYTPIDVIGEPGDRNWRVLFHRRSMSPFVVDASMVDPAEFTRVLRHYRPARD